MFPFSNESIGYKYSNKLMESQPLTTHLIDIPIEKKITESRLSFTFRYHTN